MHHRFWHWVPACLIRSPAAFTYGRTPSGQYDGLVAELPRMWRHCWKPTRVVQQPLNTTIKVISLRRLLLLNHDTNMRDFTLPPHWKWDLRSSRNFTQRRLVCYRRFGTTYQVPYSRAKQSKNTVNILGMHLCTKWWGWWSVVTERDATTIILRCVQEAKRAQFTILVMWHANIQHKAIHKLEPVALKHVPEVAWSTRF